ncbi:MULTISPECIES: hypothetical protein [Nostocales]|jgi:5-enolpyruvylshikimate-3-phosphate synthase|nr:MULTISPECIES: hypothetical protein [Nostocales]AFW92989.1 hypothetical protein ANA_C10181 [Anabaena sp. 90]
MESDRITVMAQQLNKMGAKIITGVETMPKSISYHTELINLNG